jgi:DNA-binding LytR/AlgR family response regulator
MISKDLNKLIELVKRDFLLLISISLSVFFFVLFFQPFPLDYFEFNNKLIFVAGLGTIVFLFMLLVRIVFPWSIKKYDIGKHESDLPDYFGGLVILILSSVSFAFYLHYVGFVGISFYIMLKVVLICLAPPVVLRFYDLFAELKQQNNHLIKEKKILHDQLEAYEENTLNKSIEFITENNLDNLKLPIIDVVFIRSADNYVEVVFKEGDKFRKKLIRNTLKNIEFQLKPFSNFIRCHRISIVNTFHIEKLDKRLNNFSVKLKGYDEQLPVSRQYLLTLKEALQ